MNFINSDFSGFTMNFYSSKINEAFLSGSKLSTKVISKTPHSTARENFHQQRIANSQLKKLHEQQGDAVGASIYFANEMNS